MVFWQWAVAVAVAVAVAEISLFPYFLRSVETQIKETLWMGKRASLHGMAQAVRGQVAPGPKQPQNTRQNH